MGRSGEGPQVRRSTVQLLAATCSVGLLSVLSPSPAGAAETEQPVSSGAGPATGGPSVGLEPSPMDVLFPDTRRRYLSIGLDTLRFNPQQEALTSVYPDSPWRFGLSVGAYYRHRIHPVLKVSAARMDGLAIGQFTAEPSEDAATLWIFPVEAGVEYLFDYSWDQVVIPFVGAGADAYSWREVSPDATTTGVKWGVHGTAGLMMRLNFMETTTHWAAGGGFKPTDAGLSVSLTYSWVDSFGRAGLDFSGFQIGVGGTVAF